MKNHIAYISKVFDWFDRDFGGTDVKIRDFIAKYLPKDISEDIKSNLSIWEIKYKDYNWNLNEKK